MAPNSDSTVDVPIWITRDGDEVPITQMSNSHLLNTIRYLKRRRDKLRSEESAGLHFLGRLSSDSMGAHAADQEIDAITAKLIATSIWIGILTTEAEKRSLLK